MRDLRDAADELTVRQRKLVRALLEQPTIAEAADTAGVSEATAYRWMKEAAFQAALREAERQVWDGIRRSLTARGRDAVDALGSVLADESQPGSARVSAAKAVLDQLRQLREDDLVERIEAIEQILAEEKTKP
jgi:DNA-binding MurR/RpiR family transcriptional regulator